MADKYTSINKCILAFSDMIGARTSMKMNGQAFGHANNYGLQLSFAHQIKICVKAHSARDTFAISSHSEKIFVSAIMANFVLDV